jgi:hypothetical protein
MVMDKPHGRMKMQHFSESGEVTAELLVEGGTVYVRGPMRPQWTALPMDAQTQKSRIRPVNPWPRVRVAAVGCRSGIWVGVEAA